MIGNKLILMPRILETGENISQYWIIDANNKVEI